MTDDVGDVVDRDQGVPRVLSEKCNTCIYRPGNLMHLREGRKEEMERGSLERDSWIVCHKTLPASGQPVGTQAICRGYWDVNKFNSLGCRLVLMFGGPVEVEEPSNGT